MKLALKPIATTSLCLFVGVFFGIMAVNVTAKQRSDLASRLPLKDLQTFTEIFSRVKDAYIEEVSDSTLLENAIQGMLSELDPHSAYLKPEETESLKISTTGQFGGLGIEVDMQDGFVRVVSPIDDTPAKRAGIEAGDLIVRLNEEPVKGMTLSDAVKIMRGKPGTDIELTIIREGETKPLIIKVTRDIIKVVSVKSRMLEEGYAYVRISQFQIKTGKELDTAIKSLQEESNGLKGMVLDLRNNPGGLLKASVEVVERFIDEGLVVYTKGRIAGSQQEFNVKRLSRAHAIPMVVLVNGGSASASEIVAGALQDHKRAIILGTNTFGKGSVQTVLPLNDQRALKLTTALYYTPSGRSIQAEGIKPDIEVEQGQFKKGRQSASYLKESDLSGHIKNGKNSNKPKSEKEKLLEKESPKEEKSIAEEDYQLFEALNVLKSMQIIQKLSASL